MKRLIQSCLSCFGLELIRKNSIKPATTPHYAMPDGISRIRHAMSLGFSAMDIVDAGAFVGTWTTEVAGIFPQSRFLLIEPNPSVRDKIKETTGFLGSRAIHEPVAVADRESMMTFNIWGDPMAATSASLHSHVRGAPDQAIDVRVETLDGLIDKHDFSPSLIKIDLQGGELAALRGATKALQSCELFVVEFGCLSAYLNRTTPRELMEIFYDHGYGLYDIVDCHYRPYDGALTGGDFFFVRNDSALKEHLDYN